MAESYTSAEQLKAIVADIDNAAAAYDPNGPVDALDGQRATLRASALRLLNAASTPEDLVWQNLASQTQQVAIRVGFRLGLYAAVPLEGSISLAALAKKVNATEMLVERVMRTLVGAQVFDQTLPNGGDYVHTSFSKSLIDLTKPGPGPMFQVLYDLWMKPMATFDEYLVKIADGGPFVEPTSNTINPIVNYLGTHGQNTWEVINANPEAMGSFQFMLGALDLAIPPVGPWFDFSQYKASGPEDDRTQLVDVGGGNGTIMGRILAATPQLDPTKCVVQDMPRMWDQPQPIQKLGVKTQGIDFHAEQPVKGAKAYFTRFITHDYHDVAVVNILSHIADAMAPDSTLVVADFIIPERVDYYTQAAGVMDQIMFLIGGKERTERGFAEVLSKVGLKINKINRIPKSAGAFLECGKIV